MKSKYKIMILSAIALFSIIIFSGSVKATDTTTVDLAVTGTKDYNKAQEVLTLVNNVRKEQNKSELKMDEELMEAAMNRAMEISILFSHTRPNGTSCYTACSKMGAENIAAGSSTAEGTMEQWMNSTGHKENILNNSFQTIGIGCFKVGSVHYWVQCFGRTSTTKEYTKTGTVDATAKIPTLKSNIELYAYCVKKSDYGNRMNVTNTGYLVYGVKNAGWPAVYSPGIASDYVFSSSNNKVIKANSDGTFTCVGEGTAKIILSLKEDSNIKFECEEITVTREDINVDYLYISDFKEWCYYAGRVRTQNPTVKYTLSKTLAQGTDYKLSYKNNINTGKATMIIEGIGKYKGKVEKTFIIKPSQVTNLQQKTQNQNSITVKWDKNNGNVTGYKLYLYDRTVGHYKYAGKTTNTEFTVKNLSVGKTYGIKARAYKEIDGVEYCGKYSDSILITTTTKTTNITSIGSKNGKVNLKWSKVSGASGYIIYVSNKKDGPYTRLKTIPGANNLSYSAALEKGKTYYIKMRAYRTVDNRNVYSIYSYVKNVNVK